MATFEILGGMDLSLSGFETLGDLTPSMLGTFEILGVGEMFLSCNLLISMGIFEILGVGEMFLSCNLLTSMGTFEILGGKFVSCNLLTSMGTLEILGNIIVSLTGTFETLGD